MRDEYMATIIRRFYLAAASAERSRFPFLSKVSADALIERHPLLQPLPHGHADLIGHALDNLREHDPEAFALVETIYPECKTLRQLEHQGHGDRRRNGRILERAHSYVRGYLDRQHEETGTAGRKKSGGSTTRYRFTGSYPR